MSFFLIWCQVKIKEKLFLKFVALSGAGWVCDFLSFTILVKFCGVPDFAANFISSYIGVTFVWFTSLHRVFCHTGQVQSRFLFIYWSFQFASILVYSQFLHMVVAALHNFSLLHALDGQFEISAKIIVTPFNLVTNFMFMKSIARFMNRTRSH